MPTALDLPAGFKVTRVTNPAEFAIHLRTAADIAGLDPDLNATWLGPGIVDDPTAALFVGYAEGAPIATSMSIHTTHVTGIYNVGVSEAARRRGYGWAMTLAAIMAGVQAGCTIASLQSSPMGYPVYAAHGFRTLFGYRRFRIPRPPAP
jgi:ribosomal protein S18 acetylase RimI-like enzyme